jgi:hypothetical protein
MFRHYLCAASSGVVLPALFRAQLEKTAPATLEEKTAVAQRLGGRRRTLRTTSASSESSFLPLTQHGSRHAKQKALALPAAGTAVTSGEEVEEGLEGRQHRRRWSQTFSFPPTTLLSAGRTLLKMPHTHMARKR